MTGATAPGTCGNNRWARADDLVRVVASTDHVDRNVNPRQVDGEDAAAAREIAGINPTIIRLSAPSAEGKTKSQPSSVRALLLERPKQFREIPDQETVHNER
jgi:hypothetical protein